MATPPISERTFRSKTWAIFFLKLLIAGLFLFWLFRRINPNDVFRELAHADWNWIFYGLALCLTTIAIAGGRWKVLLGIFEIAAPLGALIRIAQIGQFFMLFLPGPLGDDLTRMVYISRVARGRTGEACLSVVIDRVIGLSAVLALAAACVLWHWPILQQSSQTRWIALLIALVGTGVWIAGLLFFFGPFPEGPLAGKMIRLIPVPALSEELQRVWSILARKKSQVAGVAAAATVTQLLVCGMFACAGEAVGVDIPFSYWLGFVPIVLAANAIPITVAGIGVREYLLVLFLGVLAGISDEHALAASLAVFLMMVLAGLIGGGVYVLYRPLDVLQDSSSGGSPNSA